ncbi:MAG: PIN domain-containing protein [Rhodanobacteraceae bacterium]
MPTDFPRVITVDANVLIAYVGRSHASDDRRRLAYFFGQVEKSKAKMVIPTPTLAEYLARADRAALESIDRLEHKSFVLIAPFDRASAYECGLMDAAALNRGDKRDGQKNAWQKIKIDRQIVAIGKVHGTQVILSDDDDVSAAAMRVGIRTFKVKDLPLPVSQGELKLPK